MFNGTVRSAALNYALMCLNINVLVFCGGKLTFLTKEAEKVEKNKIW